MDLKFLKEIPLEEYFQYSQVNENFNKTCTSKWNILKKVARISVQQVNSNHSLLFKLVMKFLLINLVERNQKRIS